MEGVGLGCVFCSSGVLCLFDLKAATFASWVSAHKSALVAVAFNAAGSLVATASRTVSEIRCLGPFPRRFEALFLFRATNRRRAFGKDAKQANNLRCALRPRRARLSALSPRPSSSCFPLCVSTAPPQPFTRLRCDDFLRAWRRPEERVCETESPTKTSL